MTQTVGITSERQTEVYLLSGGRKANVFFSPSKKTLKKLMLWEMTP
jgi:hypothetical protein